MRLARTHIVHTLCTEDYLAIQHQKPSLSFRGAWEANWAVWNARCGFVARTSTLRDEPGLNLLPCSVRTRASATNGVVSNALCCMMRKSFNSGSYKVGGSCDVTHALAQIYRIEDQSDVSGDAAVPLVCGAVRVQGVAGRRSRYSSSSRLCTERHRLRCGVLQRQSS